LPQEVKLPDRRVAATRLPSRMNNRLLSCAALLAVNVREFPAR